MIRKLLITLILAVGLMATAGAQSLLDVKFEPVKNSQPEALYVWQDTGMRAGLALPLGYFQYKQKDVLGLNLWGLTDVNSFGTSMPVGLGLSYPFYKDSNGALSFTAGWSTAFKDMSWRKPLGERRADGWAVGLQGNFKFKT